DLNDDAFFKVLMAHHYRAILCCNLLEHVTDPQALCAKLQQLMPENAYIVVTVPRSFPYHPDPLDTMFRPTPEEVRRMFPQCRMLEGEIIDCGTGWDYVGRELLLLVSNIRRRLANRHEHGGMKGTASFAPWLFRQFRQTCVLLQKQGQSARGDNPAEL